MEFNPDGSIRELPWWEEAPGVEQLHALDPYRRVEAETICWSEGVKSRPGDRGGMTVHPDRAGAFIRVRGVDFRRGARSFSASVSSSGPAGDIELRLDRPDGPLVGTLSVGDTGGADRWATRSCDIENAAGLRDLCLVFPGADAARINLDWWRFDAAPRPGSGPRRR